MGEQLFCEPDTDGRVSCPECRAEYERREAAMGEQKIEDIRARHDAVNTGGRLVASAAHLDRSVLLAEVDRLSAELAALRALEQAARALVASLDPVGTGEQPAEWVLHGIASARDKTREAIEALDAVRGGKVGT